MNSRYDVAIVGGGVTGTALLYVLARYTDARSIVLIERRAGVATVNSSKINNSQTLHDGSIETNFSLDKALHVKEGAALLSGYLERHAAAHAFQRLRKMVIGVGAEEASFLKSRYETFEPHFPKLSFLRREEIAEREPRVVSGRKADETLVALCSDHGYAVDYQALSESFLAESFKTGKHIKVIFDRHVDSVERGQDGFVLRAGDAEFTAKAAVVAAGPFSLLFAHKLGYGQEYALLPVAGSFYRARGILNGKVYTVQHPKIPFAAVHGDPAVYDPDETRFGPTAKPVPLLERHRYASFWQFLRTGLIGPSGLLSVMRIFMDWDIAKFAALNGAYELPLIGKRVFLRSVRKIVPDLEAGELRLAKGAGGIRGQMVDLRTHGFAVDADKIVGDGIIFNMAPSPGASFCLGNAVEDTRRIVAALGEGVLFDEARLRSDFLGEAAQRIGA